MTARTMSADALFAVDADQRIVVWNREASRVFGYDSRAALGMHCYQLMAACDEEGHRYCKDSCSVMRSATRGDIVSPPRLRARTSTGKNVLVDVSTIVISCDDDVDTVIHVCRVPAAPRKDSAPTDAPLLLFLTNREQQVLKLLCTGAGTGEIADTLGISTTTVRNHLQRLLHKLGVHNRSEAIALAFRLKLAP
jgi:PAS domain S-box-containing protein